MVPVVSVHRVAVLEQLCVVRELPGEAMHWDEALVVVVGDAAVLRVPASRRGNIIKHNLKTKQ